MDGELADEGEAGCVGDVRVDKTPQFSGRVLHQVQAGKVVDGCCATALDQSLVGCAEYGFANSWVANDRKTTEDEEGADASGFAMGRVGPDVDYNS